AQPGADQRPGYAPGLSGLLAELQRSISAQVTGMASLQTGQIDAFAQQLTEANAQRLEAMGNAISLQAKAGSEEQAGALKRSGDTLNQIPAMLTATADYQLRHPLPADRGPVCRSDALAWPG
ncbi:MAG TPA: hypothetical protein VF797_04620, partial [Noviherbaspirillum sp.]